MRKISSLFLLTFLLLSPFLKGLNVDAISNFTKQPLSAWKMQTAQHYVHEIYQDLTSEQKNFARIRLTNLKNSLERGIAALPVLKKIATVKNTLSRKYTSEINAIEAVVSDKKASVEELLQAVESIDELAQQPDMDNARITALDALAKDIEQLAEKIAAQSSVASAAPRDLAQQDFYQDDAFTDEIALLAAKDDPKDDQKRVDLLNKKLKTTGNLSLEEYRDLAWFEKIDTMEKEVIQARLARLERENNPKTVLRRIGLWHQIENHFGLSAKESKALKQLEKPMYLSLDKINAELNTLEKMRDYTEDLRRIDLLQQKQTITGGHLSEEESHLLALLTTEQSKISAWLQKIKTMNETEINTELQILEQEKLQRDDLIRRITRLKQKAEKTNLTQAEAKALAWLQKRYFPSMQETDPNLHHRVGNF